jgi:WD40 repeat protein
VTCISWEPSTREDQTIRFVSGGNDNKLKIWSINRLRNNPEKVFDLEAHTEVITDVAWFNNLNGRSTVASCGKV